jgi:ribosome-associated protein
MADVPEEHKSKSQIKREMTALQKLGERLVRLPPEQIGKIDMPGELREAVLAARTIKPHGARSRQMQYIGALMRRTDPAPIQKMLDDIDGGHTKAALLFHRIEKRRDELMEGGDTLVDEVCRQFPACDRRELRRLVLNARKEKENAQNKSKAARALFRYLRELFENSGVLLESDGEDETP